MTFELPDPAALARTLWQAPLAEPEAAGRTLEAAIRQGSDYALVKKHLEALFRLGLPAHDAACAARDRWPNSIDMARLAFETCPTDAQEAALSRLADVVIRANRRRSALANACWRSYRPAQGWRVLTEIDPASPTVVEDIFRRVEWAVALGDFTAAESDLDWLATRGHSARVAAQRLWLRYRRDGVADAIRNLEGPASQASRVCSALFEIFLNENDYARAPVALSRWKDCADASPAALSRAERRLALEKGDGPLAQAMLEETLDPDVPWHWGPVDHVQWLRAGQLTFQSPEVLLAHARAARRVHPHHDWLWALARLLREAVEDWSDIALENTPNAAPDRALAHARAALRLGLPGQGARALAPLRHLAGEMPIAMRVCAARAETFALAGRIREALAAHVRARACARDSVQRADCALQGAELHLLTGDLAQAELALLEVGTLFPDRLPYLLALARLAFAKGDFAQAESVHGQFNVLKEAQTGVHSACDVRDRIVADARMAVQGQQSAMAPEIDVADTLAQLGAARIIAAPGLAACLLLRENWRGGLRFQPDPEASIPRVIAHYWQGPEGPAVPRARARWAALHPQFETRIFDEVAAADWLGAEHGQKLRARFLGLSQPALRADLFRLCWMVSQGGIFADLDEYPRLPVAPWLAGARMVVCVERGFGTIANNFLAATPGHPICARTLDFVLAALDHTDAPYAWWHTGPAQWTRAVMAHRIEQPEDLSVRYLSQSAYCRRVSTNLPYPHKHSPEHWR